MICLTRQELVEWSGYKQRGKVSLWLRENGIPHLIGADGWPRVMRDAGKVTPIPLTRSGPNVNALRELQHGKTKKAQARPA